MNTLESIDEALAHLNEATRCLERANEGAPALLSLLLVPMIGNVALQAGDLQALRDAVAERQPDVTLNALRDLGRATDDLIAHLKNTGRLRPCFNLPALDAAHAVIAAADGSAT